MCNDLPVLCRVTSHQCVLPTVTPSSLAEVVWAILGRFPKYGSLLCRHEVYLLLNWLASCSSFILGGGPQPRAMKHGGKVIFRLYSVSGGREKTRFILTRCVLSVLSVPHTRISSPERYKGPALVSWLSLIFLGGSCTIRVNRFSPGRRS